MDVFVQPRAVREGVVGTHGDALKLKVRAPARDGRANAAVRDMLARILDIPTSRIELTSGHSSRNKRFRIADARPEEVAERLGSLLHAP